MVAIALKSTSRVLRFLLKLEEWARCMPYWIWGKVILVLNVITLGQNNISVAKLFQLGDRPTNKHIY
tara:strand:- start:606 stop:806 length:201 start_codon:yes stop_codon:yes gene_type:complete